MPKINVYLPDDLAESVKENGLPVSAICQRALEQSVKRVGAIRAAVLGDMTGEDPTAGMTNYTQRARTVVRLAITNARERGAAEVGTRDLLHGMVSEGGNLGLHILRSLDVDPTNLLAEVDRLETFPRGDATRMGSTAANALELTVIEAIALGHNYVGCEHLLLGLLAEPDGDGGDVLRRSGVELRTARQAVGAALMGYQQAKMAGVNPVANMVTEAVDKALRPVLERLDRLEAR
jgi:ATP-dependent Clp protease ATP-binding subunit ClpA